LVCDVVNDVISSFQWMTKEGVKVLYKMDATYSAQDCYDVIVRAIFARVLTLPRCSWGADVPCCVRMLSGM
jgi:hypothetical protein